MGKRLTTDIFIERSNIIHDNFYSYPNTKYINNDCYVKIVCPKHGEFIQNSKSHMDGHGCSECGNNHFTTIDYIEKVNIIHKFKYKYDKTIFINYSSDIIIYCDRHGYFSQNAKLHLNGNGCPKCAGKGFYIMPVDEAMKVLANLGLKSSEEYTKWWNENEEYCRKIGLPRTGAEYYKTY